MKTPPDSALADAQGIIADLRRQLDDALAQQQATAEVLQVINASPGDLAPVFDVMLDKATRLCDADIGTLWTYDGELMRAAAIRSASPGFTEFLSKGPHRPTLLQQRLLRGERVVQVDDLTATEAYAAADPLVRAVVDLGGVHSLLNVPLRKDDAVLGLFAIYRKEVRPFSAKQIALLENFAAQAVIAIENARLITETREALEQQTATSEVLQVINSSPGDLAPVFDAMLEKAMHLCEAAFGGLWTFEGERYVAVALRGVPAAYAEFLANTKLTTPGPGTAPYRFRHGERSVIQNVNLADEEPYRAGEPNRRALVDLGGAHTALQVPLCKDDAVLGVITIYRQEVRLFTDKQIALLQNFAAQAVIAMDNARLITETREALDQQTATAEILGVINSSPGDLAPVFDAMLEKAMRLCAADFGMLQIDDGDRFRTAATHGVPPAFAEYRKYHAFVASPGSLGARIAAGESVVHILDLKDDEPYRAGDGNRRAMVDLGGARTGLAVPLTRGDGPLGFIIIYRQQVRPFGEKQIALLQNFAAQAVIAMENARLMSETQEALDQQTATAEVLGVINSSPGDLGPVFDAMLEKALDLCSAAFGVLWTYDGEFTHAAAIRGATAEYREFLSAPHRPGPGSA
jgi:GAF domain-containing protein